MRHFALSFAVISILTFSHVLAADVTLTQVATGWYLDEGDHDAANGNYLTGRYDFDDYRSFVVFDLGSIGGAITAAQLRLYNPTAAESGNRDGYQSPDASEQLALFSVATPIGTLMQSHSDGLPEGEAIFDDLGSGPPLGMQTVSAADNGKYVNITLNADALFELNAARGGNWAVGGALTTLRDVLVEKEHIFGSTQLGFTQQLVLEIVPVPEPSAVVLCGIGGLLLALARRRR